MTVQACNKCNCDIKWDALLDPPPATKRTKKGWWREDLSKEVHTLDRCTNYRNSGEFKEKKSVESAENNPDVQKAPSPIKEIDVADVALDKIMKEDSVNLKIIYAREQLVIGFFKNMEINDPNPARVGLYINNLREMANK